MRISCTLLFKFRLGALWLALAVLLGIPFLTLGYFRKMPTPLPPSVVDAVRTSQPPTIDGQLHDAVWLQAQPLTFAAHPLANDSTTATVWLLWDDTYLYASFDVSDRQVEDSSPDNIWDGDSVGVIIRNGGAIQEYRYTMLGDDIDRTRLIGDRAGTKINEATFKGNTTLNQTGDQDEGYSVEMRIPWAVPPIMGSTIDADLWSLDHDGNPGKRWDDPHTTYSKMSWDKDQDMTTARRRIRLLAITPPAQASASAATSASPSVSTSTPTSTCTPTLGPPPLGSALNLDDDSTRWEVFIDPPGRTTTTTKKIDNVPSPGRTGNALRVALLGGAPYTAVQAASSLPPEPTATAFRLELCWRFSDTTFNNQGRRSRVHAVKLATSKRLAGLRYEWAFQWLNVADSTDGQAPTWRIWDGQTWVDTNVNQELAPEQWHHFILQGDITTTGQVRYVSFTSDGFTTSLDQTAAAAPDGNPDGITVAFRLDGNYAEDPYECLFDDVRLDWFAATPW
jgi:hypothetical protein